MSASGHWHTPALSVSDGRGLPVCQVGYLRSGADVTALVNRQQHDVAGRRVAQRDPRLAVPNLTTVYGLNGAVLKSDSVDAGCRLILPGLAGEPLRRWGERDSHWHTTFDNQLRVVAVKENGTDVDVFTYADASADTGHNLRGKLLEQQDRSGTLRTESFALTGQALSETRTFLDGQAFTSQRVFSPLGAVLEQTDAGGHRQQLRYGLAGQLKHVQLRVDGQPDWQPVLLEAHYNAANQIIEQQAGNGVRSQWTYAPADGRLCRQSSHRADGPALQDFEYFYDPVGNITRIEDHAFQPTWFANQRVDGHRDFSYDSLYRLTCATGYDDGPLSDIPGLPQPTDPNNRLNYTQTYTYDAGGNLETLVHVRAGACRTVQMYIDSASNRGVRWKPNDPPPDFNKLFDRHGNQLTLQPGQDLQWSVRDELQSVTLIARGGGRDDAEHYHYSQGVRVFKRHETFTEVAAHFHQVRYLPGLEIRTKDNGEELHVISVGSARCLHWAKNPPPGMEKTQLRYSLEDHLGSCTMELDQNAEITSEEGFYPFGATAWMLARFLIEVSFKFIRYSGKEMDVSGCYYYGARFYAPWQQRWISPDPAGDVDGLNLYGFVGNNPLRYVDINGEDRTPAELKADIEFSIKFLSGVNSKMDILERQIDNLSSPARFRSMIGLKFIVLAVKTGLNFVATTSGFDKIQDFAGGDPFNPGELKGLTIGNLAGDEISARIDEVASNINALNASIIPRKSDSSAEAIQQQITAPGSSPLDIFAHPQAFGPSQFIEAAKYIVPAVVGSQVYGVGELMELAKVAEDGSRAEEGLFPQEITAHIEELAKLHEVTTKVANRGLAAFNELGLKEYYSSNLNYFVDLFRGTVGHQQAGSVKYQNLEALTERALYTISDRQAMYKSYARQVARK